MERKEIGFTGMDKKKRKIDEHIGEYRIIYPSTGGHNFSGKIIEIDDELIAILNPHLSGKTDPEKGFVRELIYEDSWVSLRNINAIEPTTLSELENFCIYHNNQITNQNNQITQD